MISDQKSVGTVWPGRLAQPAPATTGPGGTPRAGGRSGGAAGQGRGRAGAAPGGPAGLVQYAISVRPDNSTPELGPLWQPTFPSAELVQHAADLVPHISGSGGTGIAEGPRWEIVVSPGVFRVRTRDYARGERRHEREVERHRKRSDVDVTWDGEVPDAVSTRGTITGWTRKSRARLVERLADLDYTRLYGRFRICDECGHEYDGYLSLCPRCSSALHTVEDRSGRLPAMLTLTYPGDWLTVAPDSKTSMRHFQAFCKRYKRAWGEPLRGPWKKEFQRRGAPHFHISTTPPMTLTEITGQNGETVQVDFRRWLSLTWADIVNHPDPEQYRRHLAAGTGVDYAQGLKLTDPRRMALYFAKYGTGGDKEYQHQVPKEWVGGYQVCTDCGTERGTDSEVCPECASVDADQVDAGTAGRFWGYRGLHRELAIREVTPDVGIASARVARRWYRAKGLTRTISVERVEQSTGRIYRRRSTVRRELFRQGRGFICVNDGAAFVSQLATYLNSRT